MPKPEPVCEYRVATPPGQLNICTAGVYGGQVTDGMCRACLRRGDKPASITLPRVALGDLVERMLTAVGITQERVQAWTRTKDCGCKARQRWLNQWGYRKQEHLERVLRKAARWCGFG